MPSGTCSVCSSPSRRNFTSKLRVPPVVIDIGATSALCSKTSSGTTRKVGRSTPQEHAILMSLGARTRRLAAVAEETANPFRARRREPVFWLACGCQSLNQLGLRLSAFVRILG